MKRRITIIPVLLSGILLMISCEPETITQPPALQVTPEEDQAAAPGGTVSYQVIISSETDLNSAGFEAKIGDQLIAATDTIFPASIQSAILNYNLLIPEEIADSTGITLTFYAENQGEMSELVRVINVYVPAGEINQYIAVILTDIENPEGSSFFSLDENQLMTLATAKANSEKVDLIYYYGNANAATLCSPVDEDVRVFTDRLENPIVDQFSTKNNTELAVVDLSVDDFNGIDNDALIVASTPTEVNTSVTQLSVGQVIYAKTVTGKKALVLVQDIVGSQGSSEITIEVKIQK